MNVVITLPVELIAEILEGRKTFEIRSKVPQKFNPDEDVVYVVEKTTKRIPLYFTIRTFYTYWQNESVNAWLAQHASVPVGWVKSYRTGKLRISVWDIACVCKLCDETALWGKLEMNTAPQSFIYKEYEWRQDPFCKTIWNKKINIDERRSLIHPTAERNYWIEIEDAKRTGEVEQIFGFNSANNSSEEKAVQ